MTSPQTPLRKAAQGLHGKTGCAQRSLIVIDAPLTFRSRRVLPMFHGYITDSDEVIEGGTFLAKARVRLDSAQIRGDAEQPCTDLSTVGVDKGQCSLVTVACTTFVTEHAAIDRNWHRRSVDRRKR